MSGSRKGSLAEGSMKFQRSKRPGPLRIFIGLDEQDILPGEMIGTRLYATLI